MQPQKIKLAIGILLAALSFNALATESAENPDLDQTLTQVQNNVAGAPAAKKDEKDALRDEAIRRAALVYGTQYGRYARWQKIENSLFERAGMLSRVFNFQSMYLDNGLLQPPVLDVSDNVIAISNSGQTRELVHKVYRVLVPATFRQKPLNWQSFLLVDNLSKPEFPREALLPQNQDEQTLWKQTIEQGFHQGIAQANKEFAVRVSALDNAYQGMFLYTLLAMRGQVAPPSIVISNRGVDKAADGQKMAIGVQKQVISEKSYFVAQPNHWKPIQYPYDFAAMGKAL